MSKLPAGVGNFMEDVEDITENLAKIKGRAYLNGLYIILNVVNFHAMTIMMVGSKIDKEDRLKFDEISMDICVDIFHRVACALCNSNQDEVIMPTMQELKDDVFMITAKQDEYAKRMKLQG